MLETHSRNHWPAEWHRHANLWLAWPYNDEYWRGLVKYAQDEFCQFVSIVSRKTSIKLLVNDDYSLDLAKESLPEKNIEYIHMPYGDIWLRDTGPIFTIEEKATVAQCFRFNGWGGKFMMPPDDKVASSIASYKKAPKNEYDFILEGGALDHNGLGTVLTTEQCLLNNNRNPSLDKKSYLKVLQKSLHITEILWLKRGLAFDHTDGHIDNCARFINATSIVAMEPRTKNDPQTQRLKEIISELQIICDKKGFQLILIPSPGEIKDPFGDIMPASYINFLISNEVVIVPQFGSPFDQEALDIYQRHFAKYKVIGVNSKFILTGGGSFHCISQQEPAI